VSVTNSAAETEAPRSWSAARRGALTHRNYRLLWFAALGSTIGTWMQKYAQSLLVYDTDENRSSISASTTS
jgi:hypothetical protein